MSLNGRVAVVTGGGSGIGRATSLFLARDGAAISIWDLDGGGANESAAMVEEAGGRAIAVEIDAASKDGIAHALERTREELDPVTILVNNAAITGIVPLLEMDDEFWDRMIEVNLRGPYLCTKAIVPDMLEAGWGRIINISSSSTQIHSPYRTAYIASKGGINAFTRALAAEFADKRITANTVAPGYVDTPRLRKWAGDVEKQVAAFPMKRAGTPEEIAACCAFLASEGASYMNGQMLSPNGGRYFY
jgi:2-hydroxycyclohexanecarboxyl-CoA dehydrogenase